MFGAPLVEEEASTFKVQLDELARSFAAEGFDTKLLLRAMTASRAYQASSTQARSESSRQTQLFARISLPVRLSSYLGLTARILTLAA